MARCGQALCRHDFPGIAALCSALIDESGVWNDSQGPGLLRDMLSASNQVEWRADILRVQGEHSSLGRRGAARIAIADAFDEYTAAFFDEEAA